MRAFIIVLTIGVPSAASSAPPPSGAAESPATEDVNTALDSLYDWSLQPGGRCPSERIEQPNAAERMDAALIRGVACLGQFRGQIETAKRSAHRLADRIVHLTKVLHDALKDSAHERDHQPTVNVKDGDDLAAYYDQTILLLTEYSLALVELGATRRSVTVLARLSAVVASAKATGGLKRTDDSKWKSLRELIDAVEPWLGVDRDDNSADASSVEARVYALAAAVAYQYTRNSAKLAPKLAVLERCEKATSRCAELLSGRCYESVSTCAIYLARNLDTLDRHARRRLARAAADYALLAVEIAGYRKHPYDELGPAIDLVSRVVENEPEPKDEEMQIVIDLAEVRLTTRARWSGPYFNGKRSQDKHRWREAATACALLLRRRSPPPKLLRLARAVTGHCAKLLERTHPKTSKLLRRYLNFLPQPLKSSPAQPPGGSAPPSPPQASDKLTDAMAQMDGAEQTVTLLERLPSTVALIDLIKLTRELVGDAFDSIGWSAYGQPRGLSAADRQRLANLLNRGAALLLRLGDVGRAALWRHLAAKLGVGAKTESAPALLATRGEATAAVAVEIRQDGELHWPPPWLEIEEVHKATKEFAKLIQEYTRQLLHEMSKGHAHADHATEHIINIENGVERHWLILILPADHTYDIRLPGARHSGTCRVKLPPVQVGQLPRLRLNINSTTNRIACQLILGTDYLDDQNGQ